MADDGAHRGVGVAADRDGKVSEQLHNRHLVTRPLDTRAPPSATRPAAAAFEASLRVWLLQPSCGVDDEKPAAVSREGYCLPGCARLTETYILWVTLSRPTK
jgi:hypothetical protein